LLQSRKLQAAQLLLNYGCPPHVRIAGVTPLDLAIAACQARKEWQNEKNGRRAFTPFHVPISSPQKFAAFDNLRCGFRFPSLARFDTHILHGAGICTPTFALKITQFCG